MRGHVPGGRAAHREAHLDDAIGIDGVAALHVVDRLEAIGLAGEFARVAVASVQVQLEGVGPCEVALRL